MAADEYAEEMARKVLSGNEDSVLSSDEIYNKKPRAVLETFWGESSEIDIHEEDGESVRTFPSREEEPDIVYSINRGDEDRHGNSAALAWEEEINFYGENVIMTQMEIDEGGKIASADYHSTAEGNKPLGWWVAAPQHQGL